MKTPFKIKIKQHLTNNMNFFFPYMEWYYKKVIFPLVEN